MSDIVSIKNLSFSYRNWESRNRQATGVPVLSDIDLCLEDGSRTLILAPPDCGKTTLAMIMAGLVPKYMDGTLTGSITVDGHDLSSTEPWELVQSCGYVSQNPLDELVAASCEDEIAFPLESLGLPRYEIVRHIRDALAKWGLESMREASAQELSGGERKRLLLAVQDAVNPKVWILDESFDDLDISWRERLLERISDRNATSVVFGSRYLEQFHGTFDRYALLNNGTLIFDDEEKIVLAFEQLCETPYQELPSEQTAPRLQYQPQTVVGEHNNQSPIGRRFHTNHSVACSNVSVSKRRSSAIQETPFHLSIPEFRLESDMIVSLCGPNGAGKSTFSRMLCGLDAADTGTFLFDGKPASQTTLTRSVGYLFQNPDYQIFLPTVREELAWSLKRARLSTKEINRQVEECAELFRLDVNATPATMSFGLRKSLQAAVYYLLDRPFYILDELDSALTYATAFELIGLLRRNGAGILMITHDPQFADALAQRSCRIEQGTLVCDYLDVGATGTAALVDTPATTPTGTASSTSSSKHGKGRQA